MQVAAAARRHAPDALLPPTTTPLSHPPLPPPQNIANKNIRAIGLSDNARVVAVGSRDATKAAALLARWGLADSAAAYGCYEAVLADPAVDAVYIPLPSALHLRWVEAAAAAGKHVLLEKPVAVNEAELSGILAACEAAGVQLMDGTM